MANGENYSLVVGVRIEPATSKIAESDTILKPMISPTKIDKLHAKKTCDIIIIGSHGCGQEYLLFINPV